MAESDQVVWFVTKAVEGYGDQVLNQAEGPAASGPEAVGRELARLIFGRAEEADGIPAQLAQMVEHPGSDRTWLAVDSYVEGVLDSDAGLAADVAEVLAGYYRQQLESGDGQALADLGELLWHDDPELARTAFDRAVDAGNMRALISMARHRWTMLDDFDGAIALYQQGIASPDADIAAEALTGLGEVHLSRSGREIRAARDAWEQCIATGNPDWAPHAMASLAGMLERDGNRDGALAMFQAAFDTGHPEVAPRAMLWKGILLERAGDDDGAATAYQHAADAAVPGRRGNALCQLADVLRKRGDAARAKGIWREVIDSQTDEGTPEIALNHLINQLSHEGDLDGLRAAYQAGAAKELDGAAYALERIGRILKESGDLDGWREAWQQAIDAGYEDADDLLDELSPPGEEDDEPADVPAEFDPRNMAANGVAVLHHGLPALPAELNHHMAVPMAHWIAGDKAVVLFVRFHRHRRTWHPMATMATFTMQDGEWKADKHWHGTSFHDPITDPGGLRGLGGQTIVCSGSSAGDSGTILHGIAAPDVKYLAVIQGGHQERQPLDNHFGSWVIRTTKPGPFTVAAIDKDRATVDHLLWIPHARQQHPHP